MGNYRAAIAAAIEYEELCMQLQAVAGPAAYDRAMSDALRRRRERGYTWPQALRSVLDDVAAGRLTY